MKLLLYTCCFLLIISCQKEKKIKKPSFLIGDWIRVNDKQGNYTYETWNTNLTGLGIL